MQSLATRRLIDAAATLEAADRALLNLWVNRGFDTDRLAALSRMPSATLEDRRERIVEHLSERLGLPSDQVREALEELAASAREAVATDLNGASAADAEETPAGRTAAGRTAAERTAADAVNGTALSTVAGLLLGPAAAHAPVASAATTAPAPSPAETSAAPSPAESAPAPPRRASRRALPWLGVGLLVVLVAVLIAALASGGSPKRHPAIAAAPSPTTSSPTAPAAEPTSPAPTPAPPTRSAAGPATAALAGLPGGLTHARGSIQLVGPSKHLRLRLRVTGVPAPHRGHDEVWLYNSVLDSRALGRLRAGVHRVAYRLPAHAGRFRWIDVSFQPLGVVNHSGESELRAANPAYTATGRRHGRATRRPRQLRRAASGSRNAKTSK